MQLGIDIKATNSLGNNINDQAGEFQTLINKVSEQNNTLSTMWTGTDATSYINKVNEQIEVMKKLHETIVEIGTYLIQAANAYSNAINDNIIK